MPKFTLPEDFYPPDYTPAQLRARLANATFYLGAGDPMTESLAVAYREVRMRQFIDEQMSDRAPLPEDAIARLVDYLRVDRRREDARDGE